jgi:simple sugar transport system ATP-binding protein
MMVGREVILRVDKEPAQPKGVQIKIDGLVVNNVLKQKPVVNNVSFEVRAGEIVGIAGIEGNGQSELVECIAGLRKADAGTIYLEGRDVTKESARERREEGLSHIPEDRYERGLVETFPTTLNAILGDHHKQPYVGSFGFLNEQKIEEHALELIKDYDVRPNSPTVLGGSYSGGNAQKLIVAREIERKPDVLIAAQPTRGVDIGAIEFIHKQIVKARDMGLAVLLVSADLNEIMSLSDRILVLFEGQIMGELSQKDATAEKIGLLMSGSKLSEAA